MKEYFIELNAKFVKSYKSEKRALSKALEYAANSENLVRVWQDENRVREIIWENTEY